MVADATATTAAAVSASASTLQPNGLPLGAVAAGDGLPQAPGAAVPAHLTRASHPSTHPVASYYKSSPAQPPTGEAFAASNALDSVSPWFSESRGSSDDHSPNASINGNDNETRNTSSCSGGSIPEENL